MKSNRWIPLVILALCISMLMACTGGQGSGSPKSTDTIKDIAGVPTQAPSENGGESQQPAGSYSNPMPISDGSAIVSVACPDNYYSAAPTNDNLPVWAWVKEQTGVSVEWQVVPNSEYATTIQTRVAAGVNLPDIFSAAGNLDTTLLGEEGIVAELSPYLEKYGENFKSVSDEKVNLLPLMKTPDGSVYHLSVTRDEELYAGAIGWQIRKDWLDNLGLQEPVTTDDWHQVLTAFKTGDANGDGDPNNEIPLSSESNVRNIYRWGNAWGLRLWQSDGFNVDGNGKVYYEFLTDEAYEMTQYVAGLFAEGLADPESITNKPDDLTSKAINNQIGATLYWQELCPTWNIALKATGVEDAQWVQARAPKGPNGYPGHIETLGYASGKWAISNGSSDIDTAFRWLEYVLYNYDCAVARTIGIEGLTYIISESGELEMTDFVLHNPDGLGYVESIRSIGAWSPVSVCNYKGLIALFKLGDKHEIARAENVYDQIIPKIEFAMSTVDEADAINRRYTDITTHRNEEMTKFFLGSQPLNEQSWANFVNTIKSMGIDDVLMIKQQQYDRLISFGYTQY